MKLLFTLLFLLSSLFIDTTAELPSQLPSDKDLEQMSLEELTQLINELNKETELMNMTEKTTDSQSSTKLTEDNDVSNDNKNKKFSIEQFAYNHILQTLSKEKHFKRLSPIIMNLVARESHRVHINHIETHSQMLRSSSFSKTFECPGYNVMGRKGLLNLIYLGEQNNIKVLAVLNRKVFALFKSDNVQRLLLLYRLYQIEISEYTMSPCFFINKKGSLDDKALLCAPNISEKTYWVDHINYNVEINKLSL